jgi:predicted nucleic acid-binding Zn ribbon protein
MLKCTACGTDNPEASKFCTGCGAALGRAVPAGIVTCAACGAAVPADAQFCVACGQPVAVPAAAGPTHCTACGAASEPGSVFCTRCGQSLAGTSPASVPPASAPPGDVAGYLALLDTRLVQAAFENLGQMAGLDADRVYRRQRFQLAMLSKVANLCAVKWFPAPLSIESVRGYSQAVFNFAQNQKGLLDHNALQPLAVYPVIVATVCPPDVQAFLNEHWPKRFQAYEFPVVVALGAKAIYYHRSTPVWGMASHLGFAREVESLFLP